MLRVRVGTCGLVQLAPVGQGEQAAGGVLEAPLPPDLAQGNPVFQLAASVSFPAL